MQRHTVNKQITFQSLRGYIKTATTSPLSARLRSFRPLM